MNIHGLMKQWKCERIHPMRSGVAINVLIESLQQMVGVELPEDYRTFLATFGGVSIGQARVRLLESSNFGETVGVERFFGFLALDDNDYRSPWDIEYEFGVFPNYEGNKQLPIANGATADLICLSLVGADRGSVFFYDRNHSELGRDGLTKMVGLLNEHGVDTNELELDEIVYAAERIMPGPRNKPPGYGNLYLISRTFQSFLESLYPAPSK